MKAYGDRSEDVRKAVSEALNRIGDLHTVPTLITTLGNSDATVRMVAAEALGKIEYPDAIEDPDADAVPALINALEDSSELVRRGAAIALGEIKDPRAIPALEKARKDSNASVYFRAEEALAKIKNAQAKIASKPAAKHSKPDKGGISSFVSRFIHRPRSSLVVPSIIAALIAILTPRSALAQEFAQAAQPVPPVIITGFLVFLAAFGILVAGIIIYLAVQKKKYEKYPEPLLKALVRLESSYPGIRGNAAIALGAIGDKRAVPALIKTLGDSDASVGADAAAALGMIGDKRAVPALMKALRHRYSLVRASSASALCKIEGRRIVPTLIKLLGDSDFFIRGRMAELLGELKDPRAVPALIKTLEDSDENVCAAAADALAKIKDSRAVPALAKLLGDHNRDPNPFIKVWKGRYAAAEALGEIGDFRAIEPLLERVESDGDDKGIVETANEALIKLLKNEKIVDPKYMDLVVKTLFTGFLEAEELQILAVNVLAEMGDPRAVGDLLDVVDSKGYAEGIEKLRNAAVLALGKLGDPRAIPELKKALEEEIYGGVKGSIGKVIKQLTSEQAEEKPDQTKPEIKKPKDKPKGGVSSFVSRFIQKPRSSFVVPSIIAAAIAILTPRSALAQEFVQAASTVPPEIITGFLVFLAAFVVLVAGIVIYLVIQKKRYAKYPEPLLKALAQLESSDYKVRERAVWALDDIKDTRAVPALVKALGDNAWIVRYHAARVLGKIKDPRAVPALIKALRDNSSRVRENAAEALGEIKDPRTVPALAKALGDRSWLIREKAAYALGEIGDPMAVPALIKALKDSNVGVRENAAEALGKIGDPRAIEQLTRALSDPDKAVQESAQTAIGEIGTRVKGQGSRDGIVIPSIIALAIAILTPSSALAQEFAQAAQAVPPIIKTFGWVALGIFGILVLAFTICLAIQRKKYDKYPSDLVKALAILESADLFTEIPIRLKAIDILGRLDDPRTIAPLIDRFLDVPDGVNPTNESLRAGRYLYNKIRDGQVVDLEDLARLAQIGTARMQSAAAGVLGKTKDPKVVKILIPLLSNENSTVQSAATRALAEIGDRSAVESLILLLASEKKSVKMDAARALAKIGDSRALKPLRLRLVVSSTSVINVIEEAIDKIEAYPAIVIGVTGRSEEVIRRLNQDRNIGGVKVVKLDGTESENLKTLERAAKKVGAYGRGIINGESLTESEIKEALVGMIDAINNEEKRVFYLTNPELVEFKEKNDTTIDEVLANLEKVANRLPVIKWVGISETSAYNLRMARRASRMIDGYSLEEETKSYISEKKEKGIMSVRADSLGEVKLLAEAHRIRMNLARRKPGTEPVKLSIRLAVSEEDYDMIKEATIQGLLEEMSIDDVLKAKDVILVRKEEADKMGAKAIYEELKSRYENVDEKDVVIVDRTRDDRKEEVEGVIVLEYSGLATSRVYDIALELMAHAGKDAGLEDKVEELHNMGSLYWYRLDNITPVDTEELRHEIEQYHKVLIRA
ncbi:MAG: HEAT repeat domain-containing protein [Candidatus Omnitrophota bacterium]